MKHGLRHGHIDTANVKNLGHRHDYTDINLFIISK